MSGTTAVNVDTDRLSDSSRTTGTLSSAPMGSPVTASSNIRMKVKQIQTQLHNHHNALEDTTVELKRVRQMLDPLRLSMKRYTDQLEINTNKKLQDVVDNQTKENKRMDASADSLREEDRSLKKMLREMQQQMDVMAQSITQLQGQVFEYDCCSELDKTPKIAINGE